MQQLLLISCIVFLGNSSTKLRHKTQEILLQAKNHVLQSNYESAIECYETAYKITSIKDLLFEIAMAKTLVKSKKEALLEWKIFLQEYVAPKNRKNLWQSLAECIMKILLSSKESQTSSLPSLNSADKPAFMEFVKRVYVGKGYLLCKQLVEFGLRYLEFSLEEKWFIQRIYADCLYQQGQYQQAAKLFRNIYLALKNQGFLLDEARCHFRSKDYKKGIKCILSISDKAVKKKITYHTTLISLYVRMGKTRDAKRIYEKAKKYFPQADNQERLRRVAKNNQLDS